MRGDLHHPELRPLKILTTADAVGGVWQYSLDLARGLSEQGAQVLLATMGPRPSAEKKKQAAAIERLALVESDFALEWMPNRWSDVDAAGKWLLALDASFGADLVHLNGYVHAALPWRKPVVVTAHSCVFSWWNAVHGCEPGDDWVEYSKRVSAGLRSADAAVSPSQYMSDELKRIYGFGGEKSQIIHNFSNSSAVVTAEKRPFILAAGRVWDPAKNIVLLDRIAPKLNWEVRVAGNAEGADESKSLSLLGELPHSDFLNQLQSAAIFAHPALYEPFGLVVLEAARAGCALVLSDIPSLRELWDGAAIFIDPQNEEQWTATLNSLSSNVTARETLAARAKVRANEYSSSSAIRKYRALYDSLLRAKEQAA